MVLSIEPLSQPPPPPHPFGGALLDPPPRQVVSPAPGAWCPEQPVSLQTLLGLPARAQVPPLTECPDSSLTMRWRGCKWRRGRGEVRCSWGLSKADDGRRGLTGWGGGLVFEKQRARQKCGRVGGNGNG